MDNHGSVNTSTRVDDEHLEEKPGLCNCFLGCVFLSKSQTNLSSGEKKFKSQLKELTVYILFLITLSVVIYGTVTPYQFYYTKSVENLFIDGNNIQTSWQDVETWDSLWRYLQNTLLDGIHDNKINDKGIYIYNENKLLSLPRIRQLKISNDSCEIPPVFSNVLFNCYSDYTVDEEDKATLEFQSYYADQSSDSKFYNEKLNTRPFSGQLARYGHGGFQQLLSTDKNISSFILHDLKFNGWIDRGTRAVFIDFTLYNANINMFCIVKLVAEFLPTGGIATSHEILVQKLLRYVSTKDNVLFGFEVALIVFVVYYIVVESVELMVFKMNYFVQYWNMLDNIIIIKILGGAAISLYRSVTINDLVTKSETEMDTFTSFETIAYYESIYNDLAALCLFFSWIKIFKYLKFNKTMRHFSTTLSRCSKDILSFAVMFFIIFFAFAQLGLLLFGTILRDFATFHDSTYTLFRIILGDFDFLALEQASTLLGPVFFITYIFCVFFILLNMFLAIINDTYSEVKSEMSSENRPELEFGDYIKKSLRGLFSICGKKREEEEEGEEERSEDMKESLPQIKVQPDGLPSDDEDSADSLFDDEEKPPRMLRTQETNASFPQWDIQSNMGDHFGPRVAYKGPSYEEFKILCRRVDRNDDAMGSVISKIDAVLGKLELLEKSYNKGVYPVIEQIPFPEGLEDEQTIHIPDETDLRGDWT